MATSEQLDLLAVIHSRSPEGVGVPDDEIRPHWFEGFDWDLAVLASEGLVEIVDRTAEGEPDSVAVTAAGRAALGVRAS